MIKLKQYTFNPFSENTYIIWDELSLEAAAIDPGCFYDDEKEEISKFITSNKLSLKYIINTHCHLDHLFGVKYLQEKFNSKFLIPEEDKSLLENLDVQASSFGMQVDKPHSPDDYLKESLDLFLGDSKLILLSTPGHSAGEYCIYLETEKICFTGDVLFRESIGRTDLWGGDLNVLLHSIQSKLLILPDETIIYPGHGEESTIGEEKQNNYYLIK